MNIFETASRKKFRYSTDRGEITTEQLWDLPLTSGRNGYLDLDTVAKAVNDQLKSVTTESFVAPIKSPGKEDLEVKLEVVKHVIAVKIEALETAKSTATKTAKRTKLLDALASKEAEELSGASKEELLKQLEELSS